MWESIKSCVLIVRSYSLRGIIPCASCGIRSCVRLFDRALGYSFGVAGRCYFLVGSVAAVAVVGVAAVVVVSVVAVGAVVAGFVGRIVGASKCIVVGVVVAVGL